MPDDVLDALMDGENPDETREAAVGPGPEPAEDLDSAGEPDIDEEGAGGAEGDQAGQEPSPSGDDERLGRLENQLDQLTQAMQGLAQNLGQQAPAPPRRPAGPAKDPDDMTARELYLSLRQHAQMENQGVLQEAAGQFHKTYEMFFTLLADHPKLAVAQQALAMSMKQPGMTFSQAFKIAEGLAAKNQNERLAKEVKSFKDQNRKRSQRARLGSQRPTNAPLQHQKKATTIEEALQESMKELQTA